VEHWQHSASALGFAFSPITLCHLQVLLPEPAARGYETSKLLNGIATEVDVTTDLYANLRPTLIDGLRVEHQCRVRAVAAAGSGGYYFVPNPFICFLVGMPMQPYRS
jgi:hypothetical protein